MITLIILGIFITLIIYIILINSYLNTNKEKFISNAPTFDYIDNGNFLHCPDYLAYDGTYYYLVNNDNPGNIKTFNNIQEAHIHLKELKCPIYNPISLVKENISIKDPQEGIDRKCNKKVAINQFLEDVYNFSISDENRSDENLNKDLDILQNKLPVYLSEYNNSLTDFLGDKKINKNSTKEEIKLAINNYIKNSKPDELVNYLHENCMINEYISEYNNSPNNSYVGSFYDNYNSISSIENILNELSKKQDTINNSDIIENKNNVEYKLMDEVWNINKPITNLMMNKIFSV
jgi:hypothetical protein